MKLRTNFAKDWGGEVGSGRKKRGLAGDLGVVGGGEIEVKLEAAHRSFLHMEVRMSSGRRWEITAIYASPQVTVRQFLWDDLEALEMMTPWRLIGVFNCVLKVEERSS